MLLHIQTLITYILYIFEGFHETYEQILKNSQNMG